MKRKDWFINALLAVLVAILVAICINSISREAQSHNRQTTEHVRD